MKRKWLTICKLMLKNNEFISELLCNTGQILSTGVDHPLAHPEERERFRSTSLMEMRLSRLEWSSWKLLQSKVCMGENLAQGELQHS